MLAGEPETNGGLDDNDVQFQEVPIPQESSPGERLPDHTGPRSSTGKIRFPSGLDFERIVNQYSIQATRDRMLVEETRSDTDKDDTDKGTVPLMQKNPHSYSTFDEDLSDVRKPISPPAPLPPPPPPPSSTYYTTKPQHRKVLGYTGRTATRWVLTNLTGLMTGLVAIFIVSVTDIMQQWRSNLLDTLWQNTDKDAVSIFGLYAFTNLSLALLSAALCLFVAPEAVGSGIPEVKAYLNGVRVKRFTSMRLFFVKIVGTILSVSSGLVVGPEGPLVHIGAILGASCTKISNLLLRIFPTSSLYFINERVWTFVMMDLSHFSIDAERRDLVSIGSAAGFAAAFGAPIGGLLFSMEEASSYFDQSMFFKTLSATAIATFCLAAAHGDLSDYSIISLGNFQTPNQNIFLNRVEELPLYILVAIAGGTLGGLFCRIWNMLEVFRRQRYTDSRKRTIWRLCEVALVSLLSSALMYFIPLMSWTCRAVDVDDDLVDDDAVDLYRFHAHQFDCPPGHINVLADIVFGSREDAISSILTDPDQFSPWTLFMVGTIFFPLMTLTLGTALPTGIFMPTFLIGVSFGGAAGMLFREWVAEELKPSTFALLGAAALLAGIQRSTVSLCVILVEGTGQVKVLIPVIITVVVARYVAGLIHKHGLYETAIEVNHYPYLDQEEKKGYDIFQVKDIMSAPPVTLGPRERAHTLVKLLRESTHHGFPIACPFTKRFLGLVRRDQIVALLECGVFDEADETSSYCSDDDDQSSRGAASCATTPEQWTQSPLMHLAYHIKDDRYDHMEDNGGRRQSLQKGALDRTLANDAFDTNAWLVATRQGFASLNSLKSKKGLESRISESSLLDSLPPLTATTTTTARAANSSCRKSEPGSPDTSGLDENSQKGSSQIARVGVNSMGDVYIQWLNPLYKRKWLNLGLVMNRGAHAVTEFCPLSKARYLFTALGLRHLIVLGGETGGCVVGIITRIDLLDETIAERTGCEIECY